MGNMLHHALHVTEAGKEYAWSTNSPVAQEWLLLPGKR